MVEYLLILVLTGSTTNTSIPSVAITTQVVATKEDCERLRNVFVQNNNFNVGQSIMYKARAQCVEIHSTKNSLK